MSRRRSPAKVIGQPRRLRARDQRLQLSQVIFVQRLGRAEIHGHAMLHHAIPFEDLIKHRERPPAIDHEILGDDLEPINHRLGFKDVLIVRDSEADPNPVISMGIEFVGRHSKKAKSES
jgi:hypothetical protein